MKRACHAALLALLITAGPAFADYAVDATNVSVGTAYGSTQFDLLFDTGTTASMTVTGLVMGGAIGSVGNYDPDPGGELGLDTGLSVTVRPGWRITSLTFSGIATGTLDVTPPPAGIPAEQTPYAHNGIFFKWSVDDRGGPLYEARANDIDGQQLFSATAAQDLSGHHVLHMHTALFASGMGYREQVLDESGQYHWQEYPATSWISLDNLVLTVTMEQGALPVPEPGTYAMLLGGLAVLGVAARGRRKAAKH